MKQKGRTPPPAVIEHAANLRDRLGRAAYDAMPVEPGDLSWERLTESGRDIWRTVGQAVMDTLVKRGDGERGEISVSSIISHRNGKPFLHLEIDRSPAQLTPGKAREIALLLLETAEEAESNAVLMAFARNNLDLDDSHAGQLVAELRQSRINARGREVESA
jgi:hypothetical protein